MEIYIKLYLYTYFDPYLNTEIGIQHFDYLQLGIYDKYLHNLRL